MPELRVAVVGAGIVGLATAAACVQRGCSVTVIDKEGVAAGASRGNAAAIAWTDVAPLASPGLWKDALRWLADPLGPLSVRPAYALKALPWMVRFMMASRRDRVAASTEALAAFNAGALPSWERLWRASGTHNQVRYDGCLEIYTDAGKLAASRAGWAQQRDFGIDVQELTAAGVRELEPAVSQAVAGGALVPGWAQVDDPLQLCQGLAGWLRSQGVEFKGGSISSTVPEGEGVKLLAADGTAFSADRAVVACGAWSKTLAASLGDRVPLDTERGYNITVKDPAIKLRRFVMLPGHGFVLSPLSIGLRIGGAVEFGGLDLPPNWNRVSAMVTRASELFPGLDASDGERWMGFRPSLPDSLPVIGPSSATSHVWYAFGHAHHGLTQAATTGELVAQSLAGEVPALDLTPFRAQRF